ncbi:hypothetical protein BY996DRAFT_6422719 [Phakopsora pachyrhizi]|nr:hypothetical protein BY996DRAFT_6422719 [Phakopsora pachyrhizi]
MAESPQMADWIAKEDDFQLKQAQKQAEIQVREKRAKPIDLLALNLTWGHRDFTDESAGGNLQRNETHEAKNEDTVKDAEDLPEGFEIEMDTKPLKQLSNEDQSLIFFYLMKTGIKIINKRQMVLNTRFVSKVKPNMNPQDQEILDQDALAEKLYAQEAEKRLAEAEEVFELEAKTGRQSYNWEDKHRPHKPCYFYNQTHYNTDNPPPKVVQGYIFCKLYSPKNDSQIGEEKSNCV